MRPIVIAKYRRRPASALVMVILVLAGILTAVFGTQRLVLVQFNQATAEEDNLLALYAAKAGIEDGLIRFRFQRNVETERSTSPVKVHRFDLTAGLNKGEIEENTAIGELLPDHQYYDLKINYRGSSVGDFGNLSNGPKLAKDDVIELTGWPAGEYYLRLGLKFNCQQGLSGVAQIEIIKKTLATNERKFIQDTVLQLAGQDYFSNRDLSEGGRNNQPMADQTDIATTFRLRAVHCDLQYALRTSVSPTGLGDAGTEPKFDTGTTTLTATGYFGRAKHTLVGQIDRSSGRLLGIFDFNLSAGGGILP